MVSTAFPLYPSGHFGAWPPSGLFPASIENIGVLSVIVKSENDSNWAFNARSKKRGFFIRSSVQKTRSRQRGYFTRQMTEKIDSALGRFIYSRRMGTVEPVFANIRSTLGLDRFTLRGRLKVGVQWKLYSMVHNILKIYRYGASYAC
jgi:hypothetical protein